MTRSRRSSAVIRVGILDALGRHGGMHYYIDGLARGLHAAGVDVVVYTIDASGANPTSPYVTRVVFHRIFGPDLVWWRGLRYLRGLFSALRDEKRRRAKILHIHCFHYDIREIAAAILCRLSGIDLVATLHDVDSFGRQAGQTGRWLVTRLASGLIVHNEFSRSVLAASAISARTATIPHGNYIDAYPSPPSRSRARSCLQLPLSGFMLLFFGNARIEKGLDLVIEAFRRLPQLPALLVVAGKISVPDLTRLQALEDNELRGRIRIDAGHISDEDAEAYYRASNLVVVPYRRIYESGVAIMAMSLERAVLYSDLPPLVESVGDSGILFSSEDLYSLMGRLSYAYSRTEALDQLGRKGHLRVREGRDWREIGVRTVRFYNDCLGLPGNV